MKRRDHIVLLILCLVFVLIVLIPWKRLEKNYTEMNSSELSEHFYSYEVDPSIDQLSFVWKGNDGEMISSLGSWKDQVAKEGKKLVFATNGGMYKADRSPVGLYINNGREVTPLNTKTEGFGNFFLQPNGVLFLSNDGQMIKAGICVTQDFTNHNHVNFATQSGPMLLINGEINTLFNAQSTSRFVRNGVGILPNGNLIFAMSKTEISFYHFARFFKEQGCINALYLDGFVSRMYALNATGGQIEQLDGEFGVMIGVIQ